jgi:hypothetical protein
MEIVGIATIGVVTTIAISCYHLINFDTFFLSTGNVISFKNLFIMITHLP